MPTTGQRVSEWLYGIALIASAGLFLTQAWRIYQKKSAEGVSLMTFAGFNVIQIFGLINGLYFQDYGLVVGITMKIVACGLVTGQVLYYTFWKRRETVAKCA